MLFWIFLLYTAVAFITYGFFACIFLFDGGKGFVESCIHCMATVGSAIVWPLFFIYLGICYVFNIPNTFLEILKQ